jgi:hypothetical protein
VSVARGVANRQKKIREVEQQLTTSSCVEMNSQTRRESPLKMGGSRTMIAPGTRDAPKFSLKKLQELRRLLRIMEDLWQEAGVVDDDVKKMMIG